MERDRLIKVLAIITQAYAVGFREDMIGALLHSGAFRGIWENGERDHQLVELVDELDRALVANKWKIGSLPAAHTD